MSAPLLSTAFDGPDPRLAWLRCQSAQCRARARLASPLESHLHPQPPEACAQTLILVLQALLPARLRLYGIPSTETSFDEAWLLAALGAADREDHHSMQFLLARRLPTHARRPVSVLITKLARAMALSLDNPV